MPIEAATKVSEFNPLWPTGLDEKGEGDDHIRMMKSALQADVSKLVRSELVTFVTAPNIAFALNAKCIDVEFELIGGGGGAGALLASTASTMGVAGGGGGGERAVLRQSNPVIATTWNLTPGAGGAGGIAGGAAAGTGGTTTVTNGTLTCTAIGGAGGLQGTPASAGFAAAGGIGGTGGTGGDPNERIGGKNGGHGTNAGNQIIPSSGCGGDSARGWGLGGMNNLFQGPSISGTGWGSGSSGPASNISQPAKNGLPGRPGVIIVRQWLAPT